MAGPAIAKYVKAVEGRLVPRWGTSTFFGARVTSKEERAKGAPPIEWNTERVYAITETFEIAHPRELRQAIKNGDLALTDEASFSAWKRKQGEQEEAAAKAAEEAAKEKEAAKADASAQNEGGEDEADSEGSEEPAGPAATKTNARTRKGK